MPERIFTQVFGVVGAIIEKEGKILLVKEAGTVDKGKWNVPAGWIEVGQNPIDMVKIEVEEETGLKFEPTGLVGVYSVAKHYPREEEGRKVRHPLMLCFRGDVVGGEMIDHNEEIAETKWFEPNAINDMDQTTLRDLDIKKRVEDYFAGRNFPLDIIRHAVQE